jgi:hypothetical protein
MDNGQLLQTLSDETVVFGHFRRLFPRDAPDSSPTVRAAVQRYQQARAALEKQGNTGLRQLETLLRRRP